MKKEIILALLFALPLSVLAQKEKIQAKDGNEQYRSGRYDEAIEAYTKALEEDSEYTEALFNTGNALQQKARRLAEKAQSTEDPEEKKRLIEVAKTTSQKAASQFASVAKAAKTNEEINKAQYNLGNARLMSGEIDESIEAYKEALRKMPQDDDARYNLAYAQHMKKQQEQQQKNQQQNQDQQKQDQEKQEQQKKDQQKEQEKQDQQEQQEPQPQQLSKEEAEQLLQALMKQEKELQEDLKKKKKRKAQRIRIEKDW